MIILHNIAGAGSEVLTLHTGTKTWLGPIHISTTACPETITLAKELAEVLTKMGGPIPIVKELTGTGILLGLFSEWTPLFGQLKGTAPSYLTAPTEEYVIVTKHKYLKILAKDSVALEKAVWRFAYLIGYRMLIPTDRWEIIPTLGDLKIKLSTAESSPLDYVAALGSSGGLYASGQTRIEKWTARNQLNHNYTYGTGHSWQGIVAENAEAFALHPEYANFKKLCVLEPAVKEFALKYIQDKIRKVPSAKVVSLSISDGLKGWDDPCINTHEEQIYNPSDRQILLANYVQEQIDLDPINRGVRLSIQAYGATSIAPTVPINPRLVVLVTDGYYQNGLDYPDVVASYQAQGAIDFIPYSYLGIWTWFRGKPNGKSCNLEMIAEDALRAHSTTGSIRGAVLESCGSWGANSVGYWIMAQLLNNKTISDTTKLYKDFIKSGFSDVIPTMTIFYKYITDRVPVSENLINKMYQCLRTALDRTQSSEVKERLMDLGIYVRYLDLYAKWKTAQTTTSFDQLASHIWRSREYDLMATRLSYYDTIWLPWYAKLEILHPGFTFTSFSSKPWTNQDIPFTEAEINTFINEGLLTNSLSNLIERK